MADNATEPDNETLKCMFAAQMWLHSVEAIEDMINVVLDTGLENMEPSTARFIAGSPEAITQELKRDRLRYLAEATHTLGNLTPTMVNCANNIIGPLGWGAAKDMGSVVLNAAKRVLQNVESGKYLYTRAPHE